MGFCGGEAGAGRAQAFPVMGVGQRSQSHQPAHACKRVIPLLCFQLQLNLHVPRGRRPPCPWWSWGYSGEELVLSPSVPATVSQLNTGPEPGPGARRLLAPRDLASPRARPHLPGAGSPTAAAALGLPSHSSLPKQLPPQAALWPQERPPACSDLPGSSPPQSSTLSTARPPSSR